MDIKCTKCKNCKYVTKAEVKEYKKIMTETIPKVQSDTSEEYDKSFSFMIVGSAKRNLVVQKSSSHWDVDYQFYFLAEKFQDNALAPYLKEFIKNSFKKHLGEKYSVKLSTSVITICLKADEGNHAAKSFDVALIRNKTNSNNREILRGKSIDNSSDDFIKWENLKNVSSNYDRRFEIKGTDMWNKFRYIYIDKKCENMEQDKDNDKHKSSFSLYVETIKETLEFFGKY